MKNHSYYSFRFLLLLAGFCFGAQWSLAQSSPAGVTVNAQLGTVALDAHADFGPGKAAVVRIVPSPPSGAWSVVLQPVGPGIAVKILPDNVASLGNAVDGGYAIEIGADGSLAKNEGQKVVFPCSLTVVVGSVSQSVLLGPAGARMPVDVPAQMGTRKPLQDALSAAAAIRNHNAQAFSILRRYSLHGHSDLEQLQKEFGESNSLLYACIHTLKPDDFVRFEGLGQKDLEESVDKPGSGLTGILSPTKAADALGTFIADRFKQELNIAFLDRFRQELRQDTVLQVLFPQTTTLLMHVEPYHYTTFLTSLREAFMADLAALAGHSRDLLEVPKVKSALVSVLKPEGYSLLVALGDVYAMAKSGLTPVEIVRDIDPLILPEGKLRESLILLQAVAQLLEDAGQGPSALATLQQMQRDPLAQQLYVGMVLSPVHAGHPGVAARLIPNVADSVALAAYISELNAVVGLVVSIQRDLHRLQLLAKEGKPANYQDVETYARKLVELLSHMVDLAEIFEPDADYAGVRKGLSLSQNLLSVGSEVDQAHYGLAVSQLVNILADVLPESTTKSAVVKYGNLMVTMVNANSSEELVAALESAALPVGSYRIKRNSYVNISLNAYVGGFGGLELLRRDSVAKSSAPTLGFTAPIGVAFSWGTRKKHSGTLPKYAENPRFALPDGEIQTLTGKSLSLFVSVIDVGAVTAFRLANDSTPLPDLKWQNLLAPGVHVVYGFGRCPISVGIGSQFGPQLRTVSAVDGAAEATIQSSAVRLDAFVAVDIPFFNFYSRNTPRRR